MIRKEFSCSRQPESSDPDTKNPGVENDDNKSLDMFAYLIRRAGLSIMIVVLVLFSLFALIRLIPGDPVSIALGPRATPEIEARFIEKMHLDEPWYIQLSVFLWGVMHGDLGKDVFSDRDVSDIIFAQLPYTIILAVTGLGWAVLFGIPLGCFSAAYRNSLLDRITGIISVGAIAVPSFEEIAKGIEFELSHHFP